MIQLYNIGTQCQFSDKKHQKSIIFVSYWNVCIKKHDKIVLDIY